MSCALGVMPNDTQPGSQESLHEYILAQLLTFTIGKHGAAHN